MTNDLSPNETSPPTKPLLLLDLDKSPPISEMAVETALPQMIKLAEDGVTPPARVWIKGIDYARDSLEETERQPLRITEDGPRMFRAVDIVKVKERIERALMLCFREKPLKRLRSIAGGRWNFDDSKRLFSARKSKSFSERNKN
jgi:hypothetical protein